MDCIIFVVLAAIIIGGLILGVYCEMTEHKSPLNHQKWLAKKMRNYR